MDAAKPTRLHLALLGRPEIRLDNVPLAASLPVKGLALLAYLIRNGPCSREALAALLWGHTPDAAARASLRVTLNRLPAPLRPFLTTTHQTISLNASHITCDVNMLATAVAAPPAAWPTAVALYRGDFLDGLTILDAADFNEWVLLERERLRLLVIELLHRLTDDAHARQEYAAGIAYARRSLALDNWREEAHRQLMRLLALDGRRSDALAQFEICRRLLAENLGVEPTPETLTLYEAIKTNTLLSPSAPVAALPLSPPAHNLPASATSFVGREPELAQLTGLLAQPDGRLLTILGPGGVGKSRLALETAVRHLTDPRFADGLFFIPLGDHPPETAVAPLIADAIGLKLNAAVPPEEQVRQGLRNHRLLLVLDNFEHLLPQAGLVADLLAAAPNLRLIVTSRERLNLYEEWLVEIDGLALPPVSESPTDWADYSAPQLFIQRARRAYLAFDSAAEREAILRLCQLVGGLPLALELAAAWVRTVPVGDIARAIERATISHLDLMTSDLRNRPARQRSLRATFDYSWGLLNEPEQYMLARLAVFQGGFDGVAALAVTAGDDNAGRAPHVFPSARQRHLSTLVDKSLVRRQPDGRYQLHETMRLYAQQQLNAQEWSQVRAAHGHYYAAFLSAQGGKSDGPDADKAFQTLAVELENGRFAWQWALAAWPESDAESVLAQLLSSLSLFYLRRGRSLAAIVWLGEALARVGAPTPNELMPPLVAQLHHQYAKHEEALGRYTAVEARLQTCLPSLEMAGLTPDAGDAAHAADAWEILGRAQRHLGHLAAAETSFRRSLELHRLGGRPSSIAGVLNSLGILTKNDGRYAEAAAYYTESLSIFRQQGDQAGVAVCLINLGNIANVQGDYESARASYQASYELAVAAESHPNMAINLLNLGSVARATHDLTAADQYYRQSLALSREMGRELIVAAALDGWGQTQLLAGDLVAARATLREGLNTAVALNSVSMILTVLASVGRALAQSGLPEGVHLLAFVFHQSGAAHHVREEVAAYAETFGADISVPPPFPTTIPEASDLALARL